MIASLFVTWLLGFDVVSEQLGRGHGCISISEVPFEIKRPGKYCLTSNLKVGAGEDAITVQAHDVHIDLLGHTLSAPAPGRGKSVGIGAVDKDRITVTNGAIVGFAYGVRFIDGNEFVKSADGTVKAEYFPGGQHTIKGVRFHGMSIAANMLRGAAMVVQDNTIANIGGSRLVSRAPTLKKYYFTYGVWLTGAGAVISGNRITEVRAFGRNNHAEGIGIAYTGWGGYSVIEKNIVQNFGFEPDGTHDPLWSSNSKSTYGIWVGGDALSPSAVVRENIVQGYNQGIVIKQGHDALVVNNLIRATRAPIVARRTEQTENRAVVTGNVCDLSPDQTLKYRFTKGCIDHDEGDYLDHPELDTPE